MANIFMEKQQNIGIEDYVSFDAEGRENMGADVPVSIYRLFQYTLKSQMMDAFGKEKTIELFRKAGYEAGLFFAKHVLNMDLEFNEFIAEMQAKVAQYKIGVLRMEKYEEDTGRMILTMAEDVDCSGLPVLGETVCNYDEGFISGILTSYTKKEYVAAEINCWATGDRVCRFDAAVKEQGKARSHAEG